MSYILFLLLSIYSVLRIISFSSGYPNWGDDFAQYIHHAKNLVSGIPYSQTGYIFHKYYSSIGPQNYLPGYPLVLASFIWLFGVNFFMLKLLNVIIYEVFLVVFYLLIKKILNNTLIPFFTVVFLQLSYVFLLWQSQILPDLLLILFVYLSILIFALFTDLRSYSLFIFIGLSSLLFFTALIHQFGGLFVLSLVFPIVISKRLRLFGIVAIFVLSLSIIIYMKLGIFNNYFQQIPNLSLSYFGETFFSNIPYYFQQILIFFGNPFTAKFPVLNNIYHILVIIFSVVGFIYFFKYPFFISKKKLDSTSNNLTFILFNLLVFHLTLILLWKNSQGIRYLLLVMPILIVFMFLGIYHFIFVTYPSEYQKYFSPRLLYIIVSSTLIIINIPLSLYGMREKNDIFRDKNNQEFFNFFKNVDKTNAVIFEKPRLLALVSDVSVLAPSASGDINENLELIKKYKVSYLVSHSPPADIYAAKSIQNLINNDTYKFVKIGFNDNFSFWKVTEFNININ